jgi:hypothetical protein
MALSVFEGIKNLVSFFESLSDSDSEFELD